VSSWACDVGLVDWRLPERGPGAVRRAAAAGADGIQLDFGGPDRGEWLDAPGRCDALLDASADTGVRLLAVAGNHLNDIGLTAQAGSGDATRVRRFLGRVLDAAHALGVPLAFVPSFRRSAIDGPAAFERTAEVLGWAASEAESRGLLLASENVLDGRSARRLAERVGSPAFRLVLDTFNPVAEGLCPADLVAEVGHLLADQVHLKDRPPGVAVPPELTEDMLDETFDALHEYRVPVRTLVLENDHRNGDPARLDRDLARARARAHQLTSGTGIEPAR